VASHAMSSCAHLDPIAARKGIPPHHSWADLVACRARGFGFQLGCSHRTGAQYNLRKQRVSILNLSAAAWIKDGLGSLPLAPAASVAVHSCRLRQQPGPSQHVRRRCVLDDVEEPHERLKLATNPALMLTVASALSAHCGTFSPLLSGRLPSGPPDHIQQRLD